MGITEHSDILDCDKIARLQEGCQKSSAAGIEFNCADNFHLIGLGIQRYNLQRSVGDKRTHFKTNHVWGDCRIQKRDHYQASETLPTAENRTEIWNARYDGRFVPNHQSILLRKHARERKETLLAFDAQDLHTINHKTGKPERL